MKRRRLTFAVCSLAVMAAALLAAGVYLGFDRAGAAAGEGASAAFAVRALAQLLGVMAFGAATSALALVLGAIALVRRENRTLAIAAVAVSAAFLALSLVVLFGPA